MVAVPCGAAAARLAALGLSLPAPMQAVASYVPFTIAAHGASHLIHIAGQGPFADGQLRHLGRLGASLSLAQGQDCARLVALNVLAQAGDAVRSLTGRIDLDRLRCLRLGCFVQCVAGFADIDLVVDPASLLMHDCLGENGRHARCAAGKPSLPMGTSVEIDAIFAVM